MNDIQRASWRFRLFRLTLQPFWAIKWFVARQRLLLHYLAAAKDAALLEKEIQTKIQKAYNADYAGKDKEALYYLGFVNGIRFCLNKEWKHVGSGTGNS